MAPRVPVMLLGMPVKMAGLGQYEKSECASRISMMPKRSEVVDADGVAGADDLDVSVGVKDFGRVHEAAVALCGGGGHSQRSRFWCSKRGGILPRDMGWLRRSCEAIRMTAVKAVSKAAVQKGSRTIEGDGKAKRKLAHVCPV